MKRAFIPNTLIHHCANFGRAQVTRGCNDGTQMMVVSGCFYVVNIYVDRLRGCRQMPPRVYQLCPCRGPTATRCEHSGAP